MLLLMIFLLGAQKFPSLPSCVLLLPAFKIAQESIALTPFVGVSEKHQIYAKKKNTKKTFPKDGERNEERQNREYL